MSRRSQQRVDRRRRALVDEVRNDSEVARPRIYRGDSTGPTQRYNRLALDAINAPIARYVPLRPYSMVIWFLTGLVPILGLLLLDSYSWQLSKLLGEEAARAFRLSDDGNLMAWLSSVTFAFAVAVMLGTYSVRRYRRDDYRGNFTVWRWGILAAAFVSVDATTGLHKGLQSICQIVTQTSLWGDGEIWWIGAWAMLLGGMLVRLMFEMASSRAAVSWACAAIGFYAWSAAVELGVSPVSGLGDLAETSKFAALMLGHHTVLFSLMCYAREVVLEAMGMMDSPAVRRAKADAARAEKTARKAAAREAKHASEQSQQLERQQVQRTAPASLSQDATPAVEDETTSSRETSKSSRKRKATTKSTAGNEPADVEGESGDDESQQRLHLRAVSPPADQELDMNEFEDDEAFDRDQGREEQQAPSSSQPAELTLHDGESDVDDRKLSKAERRRLRKEQRRKKRAA